MALHAFPYMDRFEYLQNFISMNISCKSKGRGKKASKFWNLGLPQTQNTCYLQCEETKQKIVQ